MHKMPKNEKTRPSRNGKGSHSKTNKTNLPIQPDVQAETVETGPGRIDEAKGSGILQDAVQTSESQTGAGVGEIKTEDANVSQTELLEMIGQVFEEAKAAVALSYVYKTSDITVERRQWPETNLRMFEGIGDGTILLREELPQCQFPGPVSDGSGMLRSFATKVMVDLDVTKPFVFSGPRTAAQFLSENGEEVYLTEDGFQLNTLTERLNASNDSSKIAQIRPIQEIRRGLLYVRGVPNPKFSTIDQSLIIDGTVRARLLTGAVSVYTGRLQSAQKLYDKFKAMLPRGYIASFINPRILRGFTYVETADENPPAVLRAFATVGSDIVKATISSVLKSVMLKKKKDHMLRNSLSESAGLSSYSADQARAVIQGLSALEVDETLKQILFVCILRNAKIDVPFNTIMLDVTEFTAALMLVAFFPAGLVTEPTLIAACSILVAGLTGVGLSSLVNMTLESLRYALRGFPILSTGAPVVETRISSHFPFNNETSFRVPLIYNDNGQNLRAVDMAGTVDRIRNLNPSTTYFKHGFMKMLGAMLNFVDGVWRGGMPHVFMIAGTLGGGFPGHWKDVEEGKPIIIGAKALISFMLLFDGLEEIESLTVASTVYETTNSVNRSLLSVTRAAAQFAELKVITNRSYTDNLKLLDTIAQGIIRLGEENEALKIILKGVRETEGLTRMYSLVRELSELNIPDTAELEILRGVESFIKSNPGAFGLSPYLILTVEDLPDNTDMHMLFKWHQFRIPPDHYSRI